MIKKIKDLIKPHFDKLKIAFQISPSIPATVTADQERISYIIHDLWRYLADEGGDILLQVSI
jgi:hypothetical protein